MQNETFEKVGIIGVDAGLCWVGDPCYCVTPDCDEHPAKTWTEFCDKLLDSDGNCLDIKSFNYKMGHEGLGVCVSTGWGDGSYPVYIRKDKKTGRVAELRVVFME